MRRDIVGERGREGERGQRLAPFLHNHGPFPSKNPTHDISIATNTVPQIWAKARTGDFVKDGADIEGDRCQGRQGLKGGKAAHGG